jgi:S-adenosylmethionine:tRNA ribosyltransferase-isomerase
MRTDLFDFDLPPERIALRPVSPRDSARLLVVASDGALRDSVVSELPVWLEAGDQLVVNDTRVIAAQLKGRRLGRSTEPKIEATLIKKLDGSRWKALVRPARKLSPGDVIRFGNEGRVCLLGHLDAAVEAKGEEGEVTLSFSFFGPTLDQAIADLGSPPLPPYIAGKRDVDDRDVDDYQTMFAREEGAVAAPTAGLHFTPGMLARLDVARVTLHVGLDTFRPLTEAVVEEHRIHGERYSVEAAAWDRIAAAERVLAVGTTTVRVLETLARGAPLSGRTELFVTPGFEFRRVDHLLTNFHLPRSTLLALVMAFAGVGETRRLYRLAVEERYRFYSFGDAMLLL